MHRGVPQPINTEGENPFVGTGWGDEELPTSNSLLTLLEPVPASNCKLVRRETSTENLGSPKTPNSSFKKWQSWWNNKWKKCTAFNHLCKIKAILIKHLFSVYIYLHFHSLSIRRNLHLNCFGKLKSWKVNTNCCVSNKYFMLLQNIFSGLCFIVSLFQLIKPRRSIIWLALYKKIKGDNTPSLGKQQQQSWSAASAMLDKKQGQQTFRTELKKI